MSSGKIYIYKRILLFQFKNQNRMSWTDRHGTEHPLTVIGNNNCDERKPFLVTDNGEITDEDKLPIFGVTYGPLTHEAENMTISIGPLVCEPAAADQESNFNERFEALELQINETIIELKKGINECQTDPCQNQGICSDVQNGYTCTCVPGFTGTNCEVNFDDCSENPCVHGMCTDLINSYKCTCETGYYGSNCDLQTPPCPTSEPNYRLIDNTCYYFETTRKSYNDAKQNCNTKFPQGKLFEPKSLSSNKKVHKAALSIENYPHWWIGITDKRSEGSWVYDSDGASVAFSIPWISGEPTGGTVQNCLQYKSASRNLIGQLGDNSCPMTCPTICEQIV